MGAWVDTDRRRLHIELLQKGLAMKSKRKKRKFYILTPDYERVIKELSH